MTKYRKNHYPGEMKNEKNDNHYKKNDVTLKHYYILFPFELGLFPPPVLSRVNFLICPNSRRKFGGLAVVSSKIADSIKVSKLVETFQLANHRKLLLLL